MFPYVVISYIQDGPEKKCTLISMPYLWNDSR